jgi:hypothetical protein
MGPDRIEVPARRLGQNDSSERLWAFPSFPRHSRSCRPLHRRLQLLLGVLVCLVHHQYCGLFRRQAWGPGNCRHDLAGHSAWV